MSHFNIAMPSVTWLNVVALSVVASLIKLTSFAKFFKCEMTGTVGTSPAVKKIEFTKSNQYLQSGGVISDGGEPKCIPRNSFGVLRYC